MTHAIRFHKTGGPEVLVWEEVEVGKPGPGQARIRHTAVGLNFVDIYNRSGLYPSQLPSGLGGEAAGVVEEVGSGVTDLTPGDHRFDGPDGVIGPRRALRRGTSQSRDSLA
jgi:NADPH:quinone reductase